MRKLFSICCLLIQSLEMTRFELKIINKKLLTKFMCCNSKAFDVSIVLNKKLGPIFAFVYNLNDNELSSEEILFS